MAIEVTITGEDVAAALSKAVERLNHNLPIGLRQAATHVADRAKSSRLFVGRAEGGGLRGSIRPESPTGSFVDGTLGVDVVAGGTSGVDYAEHVEYGTAPHEIRPRRKRALAFPSNRFGLVIVGRVSHPGTRPRPFMRAALVESVDDIENAVAGVVDLSFAEAGL